LGRGKRSGGLGKTGQKKVIQHGAYFGRYLPNGYLTYIRESSLYGMPFDIDRLQPKGPPATLLEDIAASAYGGGQLDFSRNGTLVYLAGKAGQNKHQLLWIDPTGKSERLFARVDHYSSPALSPDGKQLVVTTGPVGGDLYTFNLDREISTKLAVAGKVIGAIWTSDGKHLIYSTLPGKNSGMMWIRADGSSEPQMLARADLQFPVIPFCISPDGRRIYFQRILDVPGQTRLSAMTIDTTDPDHPKAGEPEIVLHESVSGADISPDRRWLAYASRNSGLSQVYVRPLNADGKPKAGLWQVSANGGGHPLWARAGRQLLFVSPDNHVMAVEYSVSGDTFHALKPRLWVDRPIGTSMMGSSPFDQGFRTYDLTADGKRLIAWDPDELRDSSKTNLHITVLTNWFVAVERRFAHGGR
jgi:serine/threonine-protein kinase